MMTMVRSPHLFCAGAWLSLISLFLGAAAAGEADRLASASRIVAIGGSITEIIYALGEEGRLAARDSTSSFPPEAEKLPDIGYMRALSPEGVLSVDPDAIIAIEGSGPAEAIDVLKNTGLPFEEVADRYTREGIAEKIKEVGALLGVEAKARLLAERVEMELAAAERDAAQVSRKKRVLFILSMADGRILAAGKSTSAQAIIEMAGAVNALDAFDGFKPVNDEAVIDAHPDVILMMDRGGDHGSTDDIVFGHPAIAATPAGAGRLLVRMNGLYLLGFGPRTAEAVRDLSARLAKLP